MIWVQQLQRLSSNLAQLGARRLASLAVVGLTIVGAIGLGSYQLTRPDFETLYTGLSPQDAARIGAALKEAGIAFDVSSDSTKVLVRPGETVQARMLLAERGLPSSTAGGYELFDKLGPVGLTSVMQEVTKVRALEGELTRTIQTMKGVRAARVHIVMPEPNSLRHSRQLASASVVIRTDTQGNFALANAVRHLVAAAVPGMTLDQVSVLNTDGTVLANAGESEVAVPGKMVELEKSIAKQLQDNIRKTLAPYLGFDNFEVSVTPRLNMDKRQTNETSFDPESKVERSVRVQKETGSTLNASTRTPVSVDQNIPDEQGAAQPGDQSRRNNERREELTNYEVGSKTVSTVSEGYRIEGLTVAVIVNRKRLIASLGDKATPEAMTAQIAEIERLAATAAGVDMRRGDRIAVSAVEFQQQGQLEPYPGPGMTELLGHHLGSVINGAVVIAGLALFFAFGLRPAMRMLLETPPRSETLSGGDLSTAAAGPSSGSIQAVPAPAMPPGGLVAPKVAQASPDTDLVGDLVGKIARAPQKRLEQIVDLNEERAAAVLRQLVRS